MSAHDIRSAAVPPEQMKRQARRLAEEVFTQGDLGVVGDVIGDAYLDHGPALSSRTGLGGPRTGSPPYVGRFPTCT